MTAGERVFLALLLLVAGAAPFSIAISQTALALAALFGLAAWLRGRRPARLGLEAPLLLLLGWILLTLPLSTAPVESLLKLKRWLLLPAIWLAASAARGERARLALLYAIVLGSAGVALYGIAQHFGWVSLAQRYGHGRIPLTTNPMTGGGLMMIAALVLVPFLGPKQTGRTRLLAALVLLPVLAALVFTETRSCWLGLLAGLGLLVIYRRPRWTPLLVLILAAGVMLGPSNYRARLFSVFGQGAAYRSNNERVTQWKTAWEMVEDRPLTGLGDRDLREPYREYMQREGREDDKVFGHLHSNPVMWIVLWGVPGLGLALIFLGSIPALQLRRLRTWRAGRLRAPPAAEAWALSGLAAWTGFFVAGLFEWYFGDAEVILLLWTVTGVSLAPLEGDLHEAS